MSTTVSAQRARTAALIAAALAALGCGESGPLTAPPQLTRTAPAQATAAARLRPGIGVQGPSYSGYALASGRADSLPTTQGK
jgi:predicted small lipoprotein YifL